MSPKAKGDLLESIQGRTLLNFKSKKKPTPGRTEPAGHPDTGQAPHSVGQPGGDSYSPWHDVFGCTLLHRRLPDYSLGQIAFAVFERYLLSHSCFAM